MQNTIQIIWHLGYAQRMYLFIFYAEQKYAELSMGYHTWQHVMTMAEHSQLFHYSS